MAETEPGRRQNSPPSRLLSLPKPCLMLITDRSRLRGRSLEEVALLAVEGGANVVQLREKDQPAAELYQTALALRAHLGGRALLLVNDRVDVALAAGADGVHLPEQGLPAEAVRRIAGEELIVGRSVHSVEAAERAAREGVDFVQVGTIYETASKPGAAPSGADLVREAARAVSVPVIAIGGITAANAAEVAAAGAAGVAVIGAIMDADDPKSAAVRLREALENARQP